jgi:hypothetical protein
MKSLRFSILALIISFACFSAAKAQSADDIVNKHIEAKGGIENWKKVKSMKMVGTVNANGQEIEMTLTRVQDKAFRMDMTVAGMANYQIVTAKEGWQYFPIGGQTKPEAMTADEVKQSADDLDIQGPLINYKEKGNTITFLGKDDVEGTECYKLKVIYKSGKEVTMCFDASNYYLIRQTEKEKMNGKEVEQITSFSNYKKLPEGVLVPMTMGSSMGGDMTFKTVEINPAIDESIFKPKN